MTDEKNEWEDIVGELVDETRRGSIKWSTFRPGSRAGGPPKDDVRGMVYEGQYVERTLFVFEYEYQHWIDEDRSVVETEVVIELLAKHTESTWRLPATSKHRQLLDEARKVTTQADEFAAAVREKMIPF